MKSNDFMNIPRLSSCLGLTSLYLVISLLLIVAFSTPAKLSLLILAFFFILSFLYFLEPAHFTVGLIIFQILRSNVLSSISQIIYKGQGIGNIDAIVYAYLLILVGLDRLVRGAKFKLGPKKIIIPFFCMILLGILSGLWNHVPPFILTHGTYYTTRGFIIYFIFLNMHITDYDTYCRKVIYGIFVITIIVFLGIIPNLIYPKQMAYIFGFNLAAESKRWLLPSVHSIFCHPHGLCFFIGFPLMLFFSTFLLQKHTWGLLGIMGCFMAIFLSMRRSELVAALIALCSVMLIRMERVSLKKKLLLPLMLIILVLPAVGFLQIQFENLVHTYIFPKNPHAVARVMLNIVGINLANKNFPLGVGFGRFASVTAARFYSPIYDETGLSKINGLSEDSIEHHESNLTDTFYPHIIAESGWLGFLSFLIFLFSVLSILRKEFINITGNMPYLKNYSLAIFCYIIFISIGSIAMYSLEDPLVEILSYGGLGMILSFSQSQRLMLR